MYVNIHVQCYVIKLTQTGEYHQAQDEIAKGFKLHDGPFVKELDTALASFNVHRQAYYSGSFVGNHVHRTLKVK